MKKCVKLGVVVMFLLSMLLLTGCETTYSKSLKFKVTTGDNITVRVDSHEKWDIGSEVPFDITKDGEKVSTGKFITYKEYDSYANTIKKSSLIKTLDEGSRHGTEYIFYEFINSKTNERQFNYIIMINGSKTGVLLENNISQESAEECFKVLTFVKD